MDDDPGRQIDDRINALVAKTAENAQAIDRLMEWMKNVQAELADLRRQAPAARKPQNGN